MSLVDTSTSSSMNRAPRPSSLADVLDLILDKGLVIDAYVRISLAGIELITIDARVVVASVDTYLRFAEAVNRLDLTQTEQPGLKAFTRSGGSAGDEDGQDGSGDNQEQSARASGNGRGNAAGRRDQVSRSSSDNESDEDSPGLIGRIAERAKFER